MYNTTTLSELIYARVKLVYDKIGDPLKNTNRNIKTCRTGKENTRSEVAKERKNTVICWDEKTKTKQADRSSNVT